MATRYLIQLSNGREIRPEYDPAGVPEGFVRVHSTPLSTVFVSHDAAYQVLPDNAGVIIGHLFSRPLQPRKIDALSPNDARHIVNTKGADLVKDHWGGYVALIEDHALHQIHVLRDPSGTMPCVSIETPAGQILASDIGVLIEAGSLRPEVDWSALARFLFAFDLRSESTCLAGVTELLAGFRVSYGPAGVRVQSVWSPWDFVAEQRSRSDTDLATQLERTVKSCVHAWADCFDHVLLTVSGGLDSSILAACLSDAPVDVTYLTLATDERHYARLLARALGIQLIEAGYRLEDVDIRRSTAAHLPRPALYAFGQSEHVTKLGLIKARHIDGLMTGIGGDNVFCSMQSATPILDRLIAHGPGPGAWRTLMDVCRLTGCSLWEAAAMATRRAASRTRGYVWEGDLRFLNSDTVEQSRISLDHPWLDAPSGTLPGKAAHVAKLVRIQGTTDGFSRRDMPPQINPLLSQPIVEACLAIPTWTWCAGGQTRSVARRAFRHVLPSEIVDRRSKGGPDSFAFDVIDSNRQILRAQLLEGELAHHQVIDVAAVEAALDDRRSIHPLEYMRLSGLAEAEAWVRHWVSVPASPIAAAPI